ncbi:hypothetical protein V3C99_000301 [Haemonchus contortus]
MEDKRSSLLKIVCSIGLAFNEYFTISRLCDEYQNLLGTPLAAAVREAGFMSVDEMLSSSPAIVTAYIHAKKHYKVDASAGTKASQEISALIKHQKQKKKKRIKLNTPDREYLSRNVNAARSFRVKSNYGAGFVQPFRDTTFQERQQLARPTHGPPEGFKLPNYVNKGSFSSTVTGNPSDWKSSTDGNDKHTGTIGSYSSLRNRISTSTGSKYTSLPSGPTAFMKKEKTNEEPNNKGELVRSPAVGVKRLLQALRACGGTATSEQLRNAYRKLHNADWDVDECVKYFGISSTRGVIDNYLKDLVEITSVKGTGRRCYVLVETQHELGCATQRNRNSEETISKAKLCEALVSILIDKHPGILHTDRLTKVFLDEYGVAVEPENSLQLSWTRFITKFCSEEVVVDSRGNVSLNMKNPIVKDKVMKKSINDALEAPIDSDSDSSDDSFGSTPVVNNVSIC